MAKVYVPLTSNGQPRKNLTPDVSPSEIPWGGHRNDVVRSIRPFSLYTDDGDFDVFRTDPANILNSCPNVVSLSRLGSHHHTSHSPNLQLGIEADTMAVRLAGLK